MFPCQQSTHKYAHAMSDEIFRFIVSKISTEIHIENISKKIKENLNEWSKRMLNQKWKMENIDDHQPNKIKADEVLRRKAKKYSIQDFEWAICYLFCFKLLIFYWKLKRPKETGENNVTGKRLSLYCCFVWFCGISFSY